MRRGKEKKAPAEKSGTKLKVGQNAIPGRSRPPLYKISEEMKAWSAALGDEVSTWPMVTVRPMFGFLGVYRRGRIFAALARTRTMDVPNSVAFKLPLSKTKARALAQQDPRVHFFNPANSVWLTFEMNSNDDIRPALEWLNRAYEAAGWQTPWS